MALFYFKKRAFGELTLIEDIKVRRMDKILNKNSKAKLERLQRQLNKRAVQVNINKHNSSPGVTVRGKENNRRSAASTSPVDSSSPPLNICARCNERFRWKSALRKHEIYCSESYKCDYCSYVTGDQMALSRHTRRDHRTVKFVSCDKCRAKFNQSSIFWRHNKGNCTKVPESCAAARLRVRKDTRAAPIGSMVL